MPRSSFAAVAAVALLLGVASPAAAQEPTITGQLIDQICYLKNHAAQERDHRECEAICAKRGAPFAVLTADRKMYVVAGDLVKDNNLRLRPFIGQMVEIAGRIIEQRDGTMYELDGRKVKDRERLLEERDGLMIEGRDIRAAKQPG